MRILSKVRQRASDELFWHTVRRHKSRLFFKEARKYTAYLDRCRAASPALPKLSSELEGAVRQFNAEGYAAFATEDTRRLAVSILDKVRAEERAGERIWDATDRYDNGDLFRKFAEFSELFEGALGAFLTGVFRANFAVFDSVLYRSIRRADRPEGSQIWHADGGPGTCINIMFCLTDTSPENGAMKCLPWDQTLEIMRKERPIVRERIAQALANDRNLSREERRKIMSDFYKEEIDRLYADKVRQPTGGPGLVYAFRNNCIHAGGFPAPGFERVVSVTHVYPSLRNNVRWCTEHGARNRVDAYPKAPDSMEYMMKP
jgi:hypothetical protein